MALMVSGWKELGKLIHLVEKDEDGLVIINPDSPIENQLKGYATDQVNQLVNNMKEGELEGAYARERHLPSRWNKPLADRILRLMWKWQKMGLPPSRFFAHQTIVYDKKRPFYIIIVNSLKKALDAFIHDCYSVPDFPATPQTILCSKCGGKVLS